MVFTSLADAKDLPGQIHDSLALGFLGDWCETRPIAKAMVIGSHDHGAQVRLEDPT